MTEVSAGSVAKLIGAAIERQAKVQEAARAAAATIKTPPPALPPATAPKEAPR